MRLLGRMWSRGEDPVLMFAKAAVSPTAKVNAPLKSQPCSRS